MGTATAIRRRTANEVSRIIVDAAMKIHSTFGPGLLESAYQASLAQELRNRGVAVRVEVPVPVVYEGVKLEVGYRIDILADDSVVIEVKSVDAIAPIHEAQLLTYLRLSGKSPGAAAEFQLRPHERWDTPLCDGNRLAMTFV